MQDLTVHTSGAVITPGNPIMTVVPVQDNLLAEVRIAPQDIPKLGAVKLVPGIPIEAFVETGDRTILSYLMKLATDQIGRALPGA